jgi:hydroxypyruvate isomerase
MHAAIPFRHSPVSEAGVALAIDYASTLGCTQLNCLAGLKPDAVSPAAARDPLSR